MTNDFFAGTRGNRQADIMIVGESYGASEKRYGKPFVGESGQDLDRLLAEAKINQNDCFWTNVINEQPDGNDMSLFFETTSHARQHSINSVRGLYPQENVRKSLENLKQQIEVVKPKIIIGLGNYTLWALTDDSFSIGDEKGRKVPTGIGQWRGSQLRTRAEFGSIPFLPTYHPAAAMRTYTWRYMIKHDLATRVKKALNNEWDDYKRNFITRPTFDDVCSWLLSVLSKLDEKETELVLDLETHRERKLISCVGLATDMYNAICIPFLCRGRDSYFPEWEEYEIVQLLRKVLGHKNLKLIGHNLLFDVQYIIDQLWVKPRIFFDTMIGQHVLWPGGGNPLDARSNKSLNQGVQRKALYNCASLYCSFYAYWKDEGKDMDDAVDENKGWIYNCKDCTYTFEVYEQENNLIDTFKLREQFEFQMRTANDMALPMMIRGVKVDIDEKKKIGNELEKAMRDYDHALNSLIPEEIRKEVEPKAWKKNTKTGLKEKAQWFTSPSQQAKIFYEYLNIKPVLNKKTKRPTLNKDSLPILAQREPIIQPIVDKLEIRRSIGVYHSTFAEMEIDPDGRMRSSYNVTGTDTYRFSSSENIYDRGGNLQNIPSGKETDAEIAFQFPNMRRHFTPDPGFELAEFDLSGADAQVVAWEAEDEDLMRAFESGVKIHLKNTRDVFSEKVKDMTDEEIKAGSGMPGSIYDSVKKATHGTNYGGTASTLAYRLHWKQSEAEEFQEKWFHLHPNILNWHRRTERCLNGLQCWSCFGYTNGAHICPTCGAHVGRTIGNRFGYRVVYFDRVNELLTKALAWTPQSSVAINCNKGAIAIVDNVPWCELLLQVHDSIIVQYPIKFSDRLDDIKKALHSVSIPYKKRPLTIPWEAKVSRKNWGDAEKIKW